MVLNSNKYKLSYTIPIILKYFFCLISVFFSFSCEKQLLHEEFNNDPIGNFNAFWNEFDRFYGAFEAKNVNWDSLKTVYGSKISMNSTNYDVYQSICKLLASINDGHASIYASEFGSFRSWSRRNKLYFSDINTFNYKYIQEWTELIQNKYIGISLKTDVSLGYLFYYGIIFYDNLSVGYICISTFIKENFPLGFVQKAAESMKNCDGLIIDLRFNGGGSTETFVNAMNLFTTEKKIYLKSKFRNGPKHNDFSKMFEHFTDANYNNGLINKPIALLVNSFTSSSAEHFLLGMKSQKNVFSVGDTTCGAFSTVQERILPNGWVYRFGAQVIYTPDDKLYTDAKGRYLEGIGITPDYYVKDSYNSIKHGHDLPLDFALAELKKCIP